MQDDTRIHFPQEPLRGRTILGHDRIRVMGPVPVDMPDGVVDSVDQLDGYDGVEILGLPIILGRRHRRRIDGAHAGVAANLAPLGPQTRQNARQEVRRCRAVDQHRFGRATDPGASHLGVFDDLGRHMRVGRRM